MILLDTNVISEPLRRSPEARVINWIDAQSLETLYLSAITVAELRFGIASLPVGKRRDELENSIENLVGGGLPPPPPYRTARTGQVYRSSISNRTAVREFSVF